MKKNKILYSAVLFSIPILVIGTASSFFAIYHLDYYEKIWGRNISFQVSLWFILAYAILGILFFALGAKFKMSRQEGFASLNPYKSFLFGIIQSGLIYLSLQSPVASAILLLLVVIIVPVLLGMVSCKYQVAA